MYHYTMQTNFTLHLQYRPPFEALSLLAFLQRRAIPGVEEVVNKCYRRTVLLPRSKGIIELEPMEQTNSVQLRLQLNDLSDLSMLEQCCRHLFEDHEVRLFGQPIAHAVLRGGHQLHQVLRHGGVIALHFGNPDARLRDGARRDFPEQAEMVWVVLMKNDQCSAAAGKIDT